MQRIDLCMTFRLRGTLCCGYGFLRFDCQFFEAKCHSDTLLVIGKPGRSNARPCAEPSSKWECHFCTSQVSGTAYKKMECQTHRPRRMDNDKVRIVGHYNLPTKKRPTPMSRPFRRMRGSYCFTALLLN